MIKAEYTTEGSGGTLRVTVPFAQVIDLGFACHGGTLGAVCACQQGLGCLCEAAHAALCSGLADAPCTPCRAMACTMAMQALGARAVYCWPAQWIRKGSMVGM